MSITHLIPAFLGMWYVCLSTLVGLKGLTQELWKGHGTFALPEGQVFPSQKSEAKLHSSDHREVPVARKRSESIDHKIHPLTTN